ncbi:MAG: exo-alpha-sialidase [Candidatus Hydrogenedentes bacterium]|nr:exo-alpha-sialidase [Candidatus Hydrogenedentota bacterium]
MKLSFVFALLLCAGALADDALMLDLSSTGADPTVIDFHALPALPGEHAVVTTGDPEWEFRLHNYLAFFDGKYWCMWSHGPRIEDNPTQHIRYATSVDGLHWSEPRILVGPSPQEGFRYIARGLWVRDGKLLALVSHDEAFKDGRVHFFGPSLELLCFEWQPENETWTKLGVAFDDAINNFAPKQLPSGEWAMTRRDHERAVYLLIGGVTSPLDWESVPISGYRFEDGAMPEEPFWWTLPDGRLAGIFRDNNKSKRLYRALSSDNGRTWTQPVRTNFPDATSKFNAVRLEDGRYLLVSNPDPAGRNPLCLSVSRDGLVFTAMTRLPIPGPTKDTLQYPHIIAHDNSVLIAYSRNKTAIEVLKVPLEALP